MSADQKNSCIHQRSLLVSLCLTNHQMLQAKVRLHLLEVESLPSACVQGQDAELDMNGQAALRRTLGPFLRLTIVRSMREDRTTISCSQFVEAREMDP